MRLLAFSDLHCDLGRAAELVARAPQADLVIGVGDFSSVHRGLSETLRALAEIEQPALLVPGNNETDDELAEAAALWPSAQVLHGGATQFNGTEFFGLGAGVPITPWDWSFDLSDEEAGEILGRMPEGAVLASHSPPKGHCDQDSSGRSLGSEAVLRAIELRHPPLVLCGHVHESWGTESRVGDSRVLNLGPNGQLIEL